MLLFKRGLTFLVLFFILWVGLSIGTLAVVGGIAGAQAARKANATDYQSGYAAGQVAGREIGRKYGPTILMIMFGVSAISSVGLSFSGLLPWCRKKSEPPPLPAPTGLIDR
jgi:NADH:ubiquinone oxidoreductase subunit 3 (subunit A)